MEAQAILKDRDNVCLGLTLATAPIDRLRTTLTFIFPAVGGLLFGYDIGATSGAVPILENPATSGVAWGNLMTVETGIATSGSLLGALVGSIATFAAKDMIGRRTELQIAAVLYGLGAVLSAVTVAFPMLVVSRIVYGAGFAFALHGAPAYLAEAGHPRIRGFLISMKEIFIGLGIELGYLVSVACVNTRAGWRIIFGVALGPALVLLVGMFFLPESPRWLLLQGRGEAAKRSLRWCRGRYGACPNLLDAEFEEMADTSLHLQQTKRGLFDVFQRRFAWPLLVGLSLMFFQQVTGQPSVLYYATKMFEKAGVSMGQKATGIAGVLGAWKLLMTGFAVMLVDRSGRRPLLLMGVAGMCGAALVLGVSGLASPNSMATAYLSIAALFAFTGSFQISFGPISWLIVGEVFPLAVRGAAISLATLTNFATNWVVALVLPSIQEVFHLGGTYLGFACVAAIAWIVIFLIVPETKGKTLEEIEALFAKKRGPPCVEMGPPHDAKV